MKRELPKDVLFERIEEAGDSFMVLADSEKFNKEKLEKLVSVVRKSYDQYVEAVNAASMESGIGVDVKTILVIDDHSQS